jgi:hypothetical protein
MNQPHPSWTPGEPPAAAIDGGGDFSGGRGRNVLLRIPDCTPRIHSQQSGDGSRSFSAASWSKVCREAVQDLIRPWRHPRALLAGAIGLILILVAVALVAGARQPRSHHAGSDRRDRQPGATAQETCNIGASPAAVGSQAPGGLVGAPTFPARDMNRAIPNEPAVVHPFLGPGATGGTPRQNVAARQSAGPAHLEQRLERVPGTY